MTETRRSFAPPWAVLLVLGLLVAFSGMFASALVNRKSKPDEKPPPPPVVEFDVDVELAHVLRAYKSAMSHKADMDRAGFQAEVKAAKAQLLAFLDRLDAELQSVRDAETGQLQAGYSGYERIYAKAQLCLRELSRESGFFD